MAYERLAEKITRENLWLYVMRLLMDRPMYAYEIRERISEEFGFEPATITVYIVLYGMEREGLLASSRESAGGKKVARRYYRPTEKGMETFRRGLELLRETARRLSPPGDAAGGG
ncbi:MAG: PadR family transcriptional regulator [Candidatus Methanosuratincola petrocarbonis]